MERIVYACSDDVYYRDENNITWKLKEERRVMSSGAVRIMNRGESVRGKMKEGEKPEETIKREIQEELDIPASGYELRFLKVGEYAGFSTNYATLFSRVTQYYFEAYLKKESYHPEGYLEKTPDYTSYFICEKKIKTVLG